MFYLIWFVLSWVFWIVFSDKNRWREIFPVSIFAVCLDSIADIITSLYPLWNYDGNVIRILPYIDGPGIYIVVPYLFIQWLPKQQTLLHILKYFFIWTIFSLAFEIIHLKTGHMHYGLWWNIGWSYLADWILFFLFYQFHSIFQLTKLSKG